MDKNEKQTLFVYFLGEYAGVFEKSDEGYLFTYDSYFAKNFGYDIGPGSPNISLSYASEKQFPCFTNLICEAGTEGHREMLDKFGVSDDDLFWAIMKSEQEQVFPYPYEFYKKCK